MSQEGENHDMGKNPPSSCDHDHGHGPHHHGHSHGPGGHHHHHGASGRVGTAFLLNLGFAVIELIGGLWTNSMAVLSDALHDFGDSLALGMAWWMERKSQQASDRTFSYGYRRFSVVSAFLTGVILVAGSLWIIGQSVPRLLNPEPVRTTGMFFLALLGIVINGIAFFRLSKGASLNERMLRWHFIEDLFGWILVLVGSVLMMIADWPWMDPALAILLSVWVLWNVLRHLRHAIGVFLQEVPAHLQGGHVESWIKSVAGVQGVHHVHIWSLDGESHILTAHVVVDSALDPRGTQELKSGIKSGLRERFGILEATIELEASGETCVDPRHG